MRKTGTFLYSIYFWTMMFIVAGIMFPLALILWVLTSPFDRRLRVLHYYTCFWSEFTLFLNPIWRVRVKGKEKVERSGTYIIVSNHQSGADIMVLFLLWIPYKWVAKRSLYKVPFIGWTMTLNRYIALDRGKRQSMSKMLEDARKVLLSGTSVMIFPEGTRSRTGQLQHFKSGAFYLALETKTPILPVVIEGTSRAVDQKGFLISRNRNIRATILDPLPYEKFAGRDPKAVAAMVHDLIGDYLVAGKNHHTESESTQVHQGK